MQSYSYVPVPVPMPMPVNVVPQSYNFDSFFNQLPGEVAPSVYPVYNPYPAQANYATPRPALPQYEVAQNQHTSPVRRRSSATYHPYHVSQNEPRYSPTRSRFQIPGPITVVQGIDVSEALNSPTRVHKLQSVLNTDPFLQSQNNIDVHARHGDAPPISPTRAQRLQALLKPDPYNRNKGRNVPSEAEVENLSHLSHRKPIARCIPMNHNLVPQALFKEPKCTEPFFFRHTPISFNMKDSFETGVSVRDMLSRTPPKLDGNDDFVLKDLKEREFRVQILWPGYKTFEKRIKTYSPQNEMRTRNFIALRLAIMLADFRSYIKEQKWEVEAGQEEWRISTRSNDRGINVEDLTITQMVHCGGSHWQMELWAPRS